MTAERADVVVFLAHVFDEETECRFWKLYRECSDVCGVIVLAEAGSWIPRTIVPFTRFFDFDILRHTAESVIGEKIVPGNAHLREIHFCHRHPNYRFYWFIEYDVVYTGHWGKFISSFADDQSDLLASHVRTIADDRYWYWRQTISTGADNLPENKWLLAFLPIHRISHAGLGAIAGKVREGWVGHFECLMPTALAHCGLQISDIGGSGAWTPKNRIRRHYLDWRNAQWSACGGTLQFRPPIRLRLIKNMLYHPCKTQPNAKWHDSRRNFVEQLKAPSTFVPYWLRTIQLAIQSHVCECAAQLLHWAIAAWDRYR